MDVTASSGTMQNESNEPVSLPDAGDSSRRTLFSRRRTTKNRRRWSRLLSRDKKRAPTEEPKDEMVVEIEAQVAAGPPVLLVSGPDEDGEGTQATEAQRATEAEHPPEQGPRDEEADVMNEDPLVNPHDEAPPVPDKPVPFNATTSTSDPTPPVLPPPILPPYDLGAAMDAVSINDPAPALTNTAVHESMHPDADQDEDEDEDEIDDEKWPPLPSPERFLIAFQWRIKTIEFLRRAVAGQERYLYAMWLRRDDYWKLVSPKQLHDWCKYGNRAHAALVLAMQEDTPSKILDRVAILKKDKMPDWSKFEPPEVYGREEDCPDIVGAISELLAALSAMYAKLIAYADPRYMRPDEHTMSQVQVETLYGKASMAKLLEPFGDAKLLKNLNIEFTFGELRLIENVHSILTVCCPTHTGHDGTYCGEPPLHRSPDGAPRDAPVGGTHERPRTHSLGLPHDLLVHFQESDARGDDRADVQGSFGGSCNRHVRRQYGGALAGQGAIPYSFSFL